MQVATPSALLDQHAQPTIKTPILPGQLERCRTIDINSAKVIAFNSSRCCTLAREVTILRRHFILFFSLCRARYRENILENQQPCFHLWFVDHFAEPTAWFEARTTFARHCLCLFFIRGLRFLLLLFGGVGGALQHGNIWYS